MTSAHAAKPDDASRRFLNELVARELNDPVDGFMEHRVQPEADAILDRYRAQLSDIAMRLQQLSSGALDAVALFRAAAAQAAEQLREDAERELPTAFDFAAKVDGTDALRTYIAARVEQIFTSASLTAAEDIGPLLARLLPAEPGDAAQKAPSEDTPAEPRARKGARRS